MKIKNGLFGAMASALAIPVLAAAQVQSAGDMKQDTNLPTAPVTSIVTGVMQWLLYLVGTLGVIAFVIAGFLYLTASGDEDQIAKAKKATVYATVGVIVSLLGLIVLQAAQGMLSGTGAF